METRSRKKKLKEGSELSRLLRHPVHLKPTYSITNDSRLIIIQQCINGVHTFWNHGQKLLLISGHPSEHHRRLTFSTIKVRRNREHSRLEDHLVFVVVFIYIIFLKSINIWKPYGLKRKIYCNKYKYIIYKYF